MKNILWKYPIIYLLLFCFGSLLFGLELGYIYNYGFPEEKIKYYLKISSLFAHLFLALYFFYCFVKIINKKAKT